MKAFAILVSMLTALLCGQVRAQTPNIGGAAGAPVTVLVFSAFGCPYCAESVRTLKQLQAEYPGKIAVIFKHFPLASDERGYLPHEAVVAAGEQGKFWEMHDALFAQQVDIGSRAAIDAIARRLGLDMARFDAMLTLHAGTARIRADVTEAAALKVKATPTFFIDGFKFEGAQNASVFRMMVDHQLAGTRAPQPTLQAKILAAERRTSPAVEQVRQELQAR